MVAKTTKVQPKKVAEKKGSTKDMSDRDPNKINTHLQVSYIFISILVLILILNESLTC